MATCCSGRSSTRIRWRRRAATAIAPSSALDEHPVCHTRRPMKLTGRGGRVRAAALACALAWLCAADRATAGTISPTRAQVEALARGDAAEPLALVRLLRAKDPAGFGRYMLALETEVRARGGERVYGGHIAQDLVGGELPYDTIVIDVFPTRRSCVESLRAV